MTTCPSEEEIEYFERLRRRHEWLERMKTRAAVFAALILLLYVLLSFCTRHIGEGKYNQWAEALDNVRFDTR